MLTASEMARAVRAGEASPVELVESSLDRAERWQPLTNAFSQIHGEEAVLEARAREDAVVRRDPLGPMHGVPVAVKDLFDVAGWETSGCCHAYRGSVADRDSEVVRRLREAGAVVIGKTNQHELAAGGTNAVSACGRSRNPWDPDRLTGGSSGGSAAAVAARVVPIAIGSDTGGSIRIPASFCGVAGLKPTYGRVDMRGAMRLAPSLDTAGPLASSSADLALAFRSLGAEHDPLLEDVTHPPAGIRVGVAMGFLADGVAQEVLAAVDEIRVRIVASGAVSSPVDLGDLSDSPEVWNRIAWVEFAAEHGRLLRRPEALYAPTRAALQYGAERSAVDYYLAARRADEIRGQFLEALEKMDVILAPATPFPAPRADAETVDVGGGREHRVHRGGPAHLTRVVNLTGLPALSLVSGFSAEGLPLGAQLIGRPREEALLLRVGSAVQDATGHQLAVPALDETSR